MQSEFDLIYEIIRELKILGKPHRIKASKCSLGIYQRQGDTLWAACILPKGSPGGPEVQLAVRLSIKPLAFDAVDRALLCDPGKKLTDAVNANRHWAFYDICEKTYVYSREQIVRGELTAAEIARQLLENALESLRQFREMVERKYGDLFRFFIAQKQELPMLAGMSFLHLGQYKQARECFEAAGATKKYWRLSIGRYGRYYHLVAIDYCRVMEANREWKPEYVRGGIGKMNAVRRWFGGRKAL